MMFLKLVVFLVGPLFTIFSAFGIDYVIAYKRSIAAGEAPASFPDYLASWADLTGVPAQLGLSTGPEDLVAMLPVAPEGWLMRDVAEADRQMPGLDQLNDRDRGLALNALTPDGGRGLVQAHQVWDTPEGPVAAELIRYPDLFFVSFGATSLRLGLEMEIAEPRAADLLVARGLSVSELKMPEGAPRVLTATLGPQLRLRVTAPAAMADEALLQFFSTLDVPAMNAALLRPIKGLEKQTDTMMAADFNGTRLDQGLPSADTNMGGLFGTGLFMGKSDTDLAADEGEAAKTEPAAPLVRRGAEKRDNESSSFASSAGSIGQARGCKVVDGRKVCGVAAPEAN